MVIPGAEIPSYVMRGKRAPLPALEVDRQRSALVSSAIYSAD